MKVLFFNYSQFDFPGFAGGYTFNKKPEEVFEEFFGGSNPFTGITHFKLIYSFNLYSIN
jgi:hypothetical protein